MKSILLTLNIQTIKTNDEIEIEVSGTCIYYNKKHYIISVHQGLPIKSISINGIIYNDYIICAWCDLMIININNNISDLFVFKEFVKKQMDPLDKYYINDNKSKFINHKFMEIGMIPNNPTIMYNCLELESVDNIILGQPIYNNKFAGIVSKIDTDNNHIYSIPTNYILNALNKKDNTNIYSLNEDINNIKKINYHKIICGKIYCTLHKMYIPIETYVIINSEIKYSLLLNNGRTKETELIIINNQNYNNNLIVKDNNIKFTSGLMNYLKLVGEVRILEELLNKLYISESNIELIFE
jgi:hypothetical protein